MSPDWSPTLRRYGLAGAVLTLLVLLAAAGTGSGVADTISHDHHQDDNGDEMEADFTTNEVSVTTGDTVTIPIETNGYRDFVLTLVSVPPGTQVPEQEIEFELTESGDDGRISLRVNTSIAADPNRTVSAAFSVEGDDELYLRQPADDPTTSMLQPGPYTLSLRTPGGRSHGATSLHVEERHPNGALLGTSMAYENLTSTAAVDEARQDGRLTETETMTEGDVLAVRINSSALASAMAAANGTNASDRFRSVLAENGTRLFFEQTDPLTEFQPLYGFASEAERLRVLAGTGAGTYYVILDTTTVPGHYCDEVTDCDTTVSRTELFEYGDSFLANFTLAGDPVVGYNERLAVSVVSEADTDNGTDTGAESTPAINETTTEEVPTRTGLTPTVTAGGDTPPSETDRTPDERSEETTTLPSETEADSTSTTTGTGPGFGTVSVVLALVCSGLWLWVGWSGRD